MKRVPPNQAKRKRGYVFFRFSSIKLSKICNFHLWKCWKETRSRNTGNQTTSGEHRWIYVPLTLHQIKDWVVEGTKMQLQSTYQSLALLTSSPTLSFLHCISRLSTWPTLPPQSKKKSAAVSLRALHLGGKIVYHALRRVFFEPVYMHVMSCMSFELVCHNVAFAIWRNRV